ncbi:hypothetical protein [Halobellus marinus]|uniref:hypothetical protein n=1 Tax=Halobellus marinus TaxID=3075123 RepID=UPI0028AD5C55|nr:hypothetical protein [Halobellus sp. DFY28]
MAILNPTVLASAGNESEGVCLSRKRGSMKEPDVLGTTSDFDRERVLFAFSFGVAVGLDLGPVVGMLASRCLVSVLECVKSRRREVRGEVELAVADALD